MRPHGKQFRRSLKTSDRQLANRRLADFSEKVTRLGQTKHAGSLTFQELTDCWLETIQSGLKESSYNRRLTCVENLKPFFKDGSVRNISARQCDAWLAKRGVELPARSFNIERETLNLILDCARRDGLLPDNPAAHIERLWLRLKADWFWDFLARTDTELIDRLCAALKSFIADPAKTASLCSLRK